VGVGREIEVKVTNFKELDSCCDDQCKEKKREFMLIWEEYKERDDNENSGRYWSCE
jgi:hypothetical protein